MVSFALVHRAGLALVDPLLPQDDGEREEVLATLDRLARQAEQAEVFVTIPYHVRSSPELARRYGVGLWGHGAVAKRHRALPLSALEPGKRLPFDAAAIPIGSPRRFETPLWFPEHRALAFGDVVVGAPEGLRVWQSLDGGRRAAWYWSRLVPSLRPLLDLDPEHVLVTHGRSVIGGGRQALERALASDPIPY